MKLKWYGHSCFSLTFADGTTLITDPFDDTTGYPLCTARADAVLSSHDHFDHNHIASISGSPTMINTPGMHELNGIKITRTAAFHDPEEGKLRGKNVIFAVEAEGLKLVHLGDLGHMPNAEQLETIKNADVIMMPIGGTFTITTPQAVELIAQAKPRTALAMHFHNDYCQFPISDEKEFVALTGAVEMPNEIEITSETTLPAAIVMKYE